MPKFSWKKFLKELGLTLLPLVVSKIIPEVTERLSSGVVEGSTTGDVPVVERRENAGRRSTDTIERFVRVPRS